MSKTRNKLPKRIREDAKGPKHCKKVNLENYIPNYSTKRKLKRSLRGLAK